MTTTAATNMRDITPPPPISSIVRKGSHPSLTHSSTGTSDDPHISPLEQLVTPVGGMGLHLNPDVAIRKGSESREDASSASGDEAASASRGRNTLKGRFATRSMSNIKSKPAVSPAPPMPTIKGRPGMGRERAMTMAAPVKAPSETNIAQMPSPARKPKSGGFSSFLRKLTGKAPKKPAVASPMDVLSRPDPPFRPVHLPDAPAPRKPALPPLDINRLPPGAAPGPQTAPAGTVNRAPLSAYPIMEPTSVGPTSKALPESDEPVDIPLPPSPSQSPTVIPEESGEFGSRPAAPAVPSRSTKRAKQRTELVSMPEFQIEDEEQLEEDEEDEEDEVADLVRPLAPLRIPSGGVSAPVASPVPVSASSTTSNRTSVISPSAREKENPFLGGYNSSPEKDASNRPAQAPVSPRRAAAAPAAPAPTSGLDRKGSKWTKPMSSTLDRRTSQRPAAAPSASYDSYTSTSYRGPPPAGSMARRAANRTSCAPTMHSTASVAASLRAIQNKDEADMAENFLLM